MLNKLSQNLTTTCRSGNWTSDGYDKQQDFDAKSRTGTANWLQAGKHDAPEEHEQHVRRRLLWGQRTETRTRAGYEDALPWILRLSSHRLFLFILSILLSLLVSLSLPVQLLRLMLEATSDSAVTTSGTQNERDTHTLCLLSPPRLFVLVLLLFSRVILTLHAHTFPCYHHLRDNETPLYPG